MGTFEVTSEETIVVLEAGSFHVFPVRDDLLGGDRDSQPRQNKSLPSSPGSSTVVDISSNKPQQINDNRPQHVNGNRPQLVNGNRPQEVNGTSPEHINGNRPQHVHGNRPRQIYNDKASSPDKKLFKVWEVCHTFVSNPSAGLHDCDGLEWVAIMDTTTTDLSKLMRGGFSWSEDNVVMNSGYFTFHEEGIDEFYRAAGFRCSRNYTLMDNAEDRIWSAKLCILARELGVLAKFKLSSLTLDHIAKVVANDHQGRAVYSYSTDERTGHFNAVCNDLELTGLWPRLNL